MDQGTSKRTPNVFLGTNAATNGFGSTGYGTNGPTFTSDEQNPWSSAFNPSAPDPSAPDPNDAAAQELDEEQEKTITLLHDPDNLGEALWHALYKETTETPPPFAVILVEEEQRGLRLKFYDAPPCHDVNPPKPWNNPDTQNHLVRPLLTLARKTTKMGMPSLILLPSGTVFAATSRTAYGILIRGKPPVDPRGITVKVHPVIAEVWDVADAIVKTPHPLVRWSGAVACLLLWLITGIGAWVWGSEIVVRLAQAMGDAPITESWGFVLRVSVSVAVSAMEIAGLLFLSSRIARGIGGLVAALDVAFHAWYGWRLAPDDLSAQVVATLIGVGTALLPELVVVALLIGAVRLSPLLVWALLQVRMIWFHMRMLVKEESSRYRETNNKAQQDGAYRPVTMIDSETGTISTYWVYEPHDDSGDQGNGHGSQSSGGGKQRRTP